MLYADIISLFATKKCKNSKILMKLVNIGKENLNIFQNVKNFIEIFLL